MQGLTFIIIYNIRKKRVVTVLATYGHLAGLTLIMVTQTHIFHVSQKERNCSRTIQNTVQTSAQDKRLRYNASENKEKVQRKLGQFRRDVSKPRRAGDGNPSLREHTISVKNKQNKQTNKNNNNKNCEPGLILATHVLMLPVYVFDKNYMLRQLVCTDLKTRVHSHIPVFMTPVSQTLRTLTWGTR